MNDLKEFLSQLLYAGWAIYVTIMCIVGFFKNPGFVEFFIAGFVWVILMMLPEIIRGK